MGTRDDRGTRPLLPTAARPRALLCAGACAATALLLGAVTHGRRATALDALVDRQLRQVAQSSERLLDPLVIALSPVRVVAACGLLGVVLLLRGERRAALLCAGGPLGTAVLTRLAQDVLDRPSAAVPGSTGAYPSGHMAALVAATAVVLVLIGRAGAWGRRPRVAVVRVLALALLAAMALGLTALRHHVVTDVLGAAALAVACVLLLALLLDVLARRPEDRDRPDGTYHVCAPRPPNDDGRPSAVEVDDLRGCT